MAVTARAIFQAHIDGLSAANLTPVSVPLSVAWTMENAVGDLNFMDFPAGVTILTQPATATMLVLVPPPTNVTPLVLVGNAGDSTGVALSPNCGTILALSITPLALRLTVAVPGVLVGWL
jgi:hypothetical protein